MQIKSIVNKIIKIVNVTFLCLFRGLVLSRHGRVVSKQPKLGLSVSWTCLRESIGLTMTRAYGQSSVLQHCRDFCCQFLFLFPFGP